MNNDVKEFGDSAEAEAHADRFNDRNGRAKPDDTRTRRRVFLALLVFSLMGLFPAFVLPFDRQLLLSTVASLLGVIACMFALLVDPWKQR